MIVCYFLVQLLIIFNNLRTIFVTKILPLIKKINAYIDSKNNKKVHKVI